MRIMPYKLSEDVRRLCGNLSKTYNLSDQDLAEDITALCVTKGQGIPSKTTLDATAKAWSTKQKLPEPHLKVILNKRAQLLKQLATYPYFYGLASTNGAVEATDKLLAHLGSLYTKIREAQCLSCHLVAQCEFGKRYGKSVQDIRGVVVDDYDKLVHQDCPVRPEISYVNQVTSALKTVKNLAANPPVAEGGSIQHAPALTSLYEELEAQQNQVEDSSDGEDTEPLPDDKDSFEEIDGYSYGAYNGSIKSFDMRHDGKMLCKLNQQFLESITKESLCLYELGRQAALVMSTADVGPRKDTPDPSKEKRLSDIESFSELPKVLPSQQGLPDEVFEARLEKKTLQKKRNTKKEKPVPLRYLLVDGSGSMCAMLNNANAVPIVSRASLTTMICLAVLEDTASCEGHAYLRYFAGAAGPLTEAHTPQDYESMKAKIKLSSYSGGSTDIQAALKTACSDIKSASTNLHLSKVELMLITDGDSPLSIQGLDTALQGIKLNLVDMSGTGTSSTGGLAILRQRAANYYKVDSAARSPKELVQLIKNA